MLKKKLLRKYTRYLFAFQYEAGRAAIGWIIVTARLNISNTVAREVYRMGTGLCLVVLLNIDVENIFRLQLTIFYFPVEQFGRNNNSLVVENTGVKELRRSVKENRFLLREKLKLTIELFKDRNKSK